MDKDRIKMWLKQLFSEKVCCGNKSCNRYWGCVNNCDLGTKKCLMRKRGSIAK